MGPLKTPNLSNLSPAESLGWLLSDQSRILRVARIRIAFCRLDCPSFAAVSPTWLRLAETQILPQLRLPAAQRTTKEEKQRSSCASNANRTKGPGQPHLCPTPTTFNSTARGRREGSNAINHRVSDFTLWQPAEVFNRLRDSMDAIPKLRRKSLFCDPRRALLGTSDDLIDAVASFETSPSSSNHGHTFTSCLFQLLFDF